MKAVDLAALRVHPRHDVLDGPVLAGGVHGLEDDQQGVSAVGPQQFLGRFQLVDEGLEVLLGQLLALFRLGGPEPVDLGRLGAAGVEGGRLTRADRQLFYGGLVQFHVSLSCSSVALGSMLGAPLAPAPAGLAGLGVTVGLELLAVGAAAVVVVHPVAA